MKKRTKGDYIQSVYKVIFYIILKGRVTNFKLWIKAKKHNNTGLNSAF